MAIHRHRVHTAHPRRERGAILVLTSISLVVLMAFTALAIDLGQRSQQLAGAQHAIDASVLAAAEYLGRHPADYAGAASAVKSLIHQNLGIDTGEWDGCSDADHLAIIAPNDTECVSFRPITATSPTAAPKYDIRVRLPNYKMSTIFGSALGIDTIDLAAAAASNGANCPTTSSCDGGGGTTIAPTTTTWSMQASCRATASLYLTIYDDTWALCSEYFSTEDRSAWQDVFCGSNQGVFTRSDGTTESFYISSVWRYIWFWDSVCSTRLSTASRDQWLDSACFQSSLQDIYGDPTFWSLCKIRRPDLETIAEYNATTTTMSPMSTTTAGPTTSITVPDDSTPTSIDLSG